MINLLEEGRILYISSTDVSIGNGPGVNEREFILALYGLIGDRAHFLIPHPKEKIAELPVDACTYCAPYQRNLFNYWSHLGSQVRQADKLLSERDFDLVVVRLTLFPLSSLGITRKDRVPYAIKTLGVGPITVLDEKGGWFGRAINNINRRIFRYLVTNALVADSDSELHVETLKRVLDVNSDSIVWVDNTVNVSRFFPSPKKEARSELGLNQFDPIIGYVGSRPWERGGMQLVEAAPRLLEKYPNLGVVIIGGGKELEEMKKRAQELRVDDRCRFEGYVPFDKIPGYINSLDLGASISIREDRQVNSELKVRQYLACGKPVVISPGGNEFVIGEHLGSVVQPTDIDVITKEIDNWLSLTPDEIEEFSQRAVEFMRTNLSMEAGVSKRINLWGDRLRAAESI
ncbi:MAG: glycosyltransferase family 4 protein [Anaerolineales bacterium]